MAIFNRTNTNSNNAGPIGNGTQARVNFSQSHGFVIREDDQSHRNFHAFLEDSAHYIKAEQKEIIYANARDSQKRWVLGRDFRKIIGTAIVVGVGGSLMGLATPLITGALIAEGILVAGMTVYDMVKSRKTKKVVSDLSQHVAALDALDQNVGQAIRMNRSHANGMTARDGSVNLNAFKNNGPANVNNTHALAFLEKTQETIENFQGKNHRANVRGTTYKGIKNGVVGGLIGGAVFSVLGHFPSDPTSAVRGLGAIVGSIAGGIFAAKNTKEKSTKERILWTAAGAGSGALLGGVSGNFAFDLSDSSPMVALGAYGFAVGAVTSSVLSVDAGMRKAHTEKSNREKMLEEWVENCDFHQRHGFKDALVYPANGSTYRAKRPPGP